MTRKHKSFFESAKAVSKMSDFKRVHIGCIVTDGHRIISSGFNTNKTHPVQKRLNKERFDEDTRHTLHSEVAALIPIMKEDIDFNKVEVFTYREYINGGMAMSRPCPSCMRLIKELGIKKIWYTTPDGYAFETLKDGDDDD